MCANKGSDSKSSGTTNVTTTNKDFGKNGGKDGGNNAPAPSPLAIKQTMPTYDQNDRNRINYAPYTGRTSDDRKGSQPYVVSNPGDKKGGKGDGKGGGKGDGKGGNNGGKGGGGKGGGGKGGGGKGGGGKGGDGKGGGKGDGKVVKNFYSSTTFNSPARSNPFSINIKNGSSADTFASGAQDLTAQSPTKNNLTLTRKVKGASLRPSTVS